MMFIFGFFCGMALMVFVISLTSAAKDPLCRACELYGINCIGKCGKELSK